MSPEPENVDRRSVLLVGTGAFLFWFSLYLYVPLLPLHAEHLGSSLSMVGLIVSSYAIAQVTLRIPIGVAGDVLGRRKPVAAGALACCALGAFGLASAPDPWSLFGARTLTGVGAAGWVAVSVLYNSYFPRNQLPRAMAQVMAINATALVAASLGGGLVSERLGTAATFHGAAGGGVVGFVLMMLAREPLIVRPSSYSVVHFLAVLRTPLLLTVGGIGIFLQFVNFGGSFGYVPIFAERLGASDAEVGYVTTAMFVAGVVATLIFTRVVRRLGFRRTILLGSLAAAVGMGVVPAITDVWLLMGSQFLGGLGRGLIGTALISLALHSVGPEDRGTAMGIYQAVYAVGMITGPAICGYLAEAAALASVFYLLTVVSLLAGLAGLTHIVPVDSGPD